MNSVEKKPLEKQLTTIQTDVKYCKKCVISNQRPRITFDKNGVCSPCNFAEEKHNVIDWGKREQELKALLDKHRSPKGEWDVIVPCSGGKDSSMVAHQLKTKYNMHPLTVTWSSLIDSEVGIRNYQNFIDSGFNNIQGHPNGKLLRKLVRLSFEEVGDPFLPFIFGQMCFPFQIALKFGIKLVFYGENGEAEYGGNTKNNYRPYMPVEDWADSYWKGTNIDNLVEYGIKNTDYLSRDDFEPNDLQFYRPPSVEELRAAGVQMHWFSYYHKWAPKQNYEYSVKNTGFKASPVRLEGTYSQYASLDDELDGVHYYMGYIKFGIGRATSDAAHEIRDGLISREQGVSFVHQYDGEFPALYFKKFLDFTGITEEHFNEVVDSFRPPHLWKKEGGKWVLRHVVK